MRALVGTLASLGLLAVFVSVPALSGCDSRGDEPASCTDPVEFDFEDVTPEGTQTGDVVEDGSCISVSYVGRFQGGEEFDSGSGLRFFVAQGGGVINGFWLGVREQRVGETRRITIPPSLGYGNRDQTRGGEVVIPACSVLEFEVTVEDVNLAPSVCRGF